MHRNTKIFPEVGDPRIHLLSVFTVFTYDCAFIFPRKETVLGTGEFGDVFKGVWDTPYGPQDVAIKMLKVGSKEKDIVNFLKEAALMGQFRHPNVIRLLGAVTVDDPVSMPVISACRYLCYCLLVLCNLLYCLHPSSV